jgi:hypothetical protein
MAINLTGGLPPEILGQQQQLNRQQQMAQMLMQQGQQMPQGQMVSGRYVQPSIFASLAPLAQMYAGQRLAEKGDQKALDLAKQLREGQGAALADYMGQLQGRPAVPEKVTEMAGPYGMSGAGQNIPMPTATIAGRPEIKADPLLANLNALQNPYAPEFLKQQAMKKLTEGPKWEKASFTDEKTGRVREGVINVNSPDPIGSFQVGGVKPEMSAYEKASLKFKAGDQAIASANLFYNTGMTAGGGGVPTGAPMGNAPAGAPMAAPMGGVPAAGGMPMANAPAQQMGNAIPPSAQPQYQYNPNLTPKENQTRAAKFSADADKNLKNAQESFNVIKEASDIFNTGTPTSGGFKNIGTGIAEFFDIPTKAADADAKLTILGQKLVQQVPRFEGPQSDRDVESYKSAAGDLGNANKTISTRMSALNTLIDLNKKYFPQGDWDSIDLAGPVTTRQTFLRGKQNIDPVTFSQGLNAQDKEAFNWARKNPTDPRAAQINQRLGIR